MNYHKDREVNAALIRLMDALCEHERASGRGSTLILIPANLDEMNVVAVDGKPQTTGNVEEFVKLALETRKNSWGLNPNTGAVY